MLSVLYLTLLTAKFKDTVHQILGLGKFLAQVPVLMVPVLIIKALDLITGSLVQLIQYLREYTG